MVAISSRLLLINCLQGSGGHRLGRIFSCHADVYWYSHVDNGMHPWLFAQTDEVKEAHFSKYHYDRILPDGSYLPLIGSRIAKYWSDDAWLDNWHQIMSRLDLPDGYLTYVVHDSPLYLRDRFPLSTIVNLLSDPIETTDRHLQTSANFRISYRLRNQVPDYKSAWVEARDQLLATNPSATERDLWCHMHNRPTNEYPAAVLDCNRLAATRNLEERDFADINVSWVDFKPSDHTDRFGPVDQRYHTLMIT